MKELDAIKQEFNKQLGRELVKRKQIGCSVKELQAIEPLVNKQVWLDALATEHV